MLRHENLQIHLRLGLRLKSIHHVLEVNQSQLLKPLVEFNTKKEKKQKYGEKDRKALYKLMNNDVFDKNISQKILGDDLVTKRLD